MTKCIKISNFSFKIIELDWEKTIPHSVVKGCSQAFHTGGVAIDCDLGFRIIDRIEKRKAPYMVPVDMGYQKVYIYLFAVSN